MVKITEIMDSPDSSESESEKQSNESNLPMCRYGLSCYRKNPVHFMQFRHPHKVQTSTAQSSTVTIVSEEKVSVKIEIGHKGILKTDKNPDDLATHDWTIFVQGADKNRIEYFVDKVVINLPQHSFSFPTREFTEPPFSTSSSGYGSCVILIDIFFKNDVEPKKIRFTYDLYLKDNASFTNVRLEKLTFKNPNADFRELLLKAGGEILENPDSSTSSSNGEPSTSTNLKRKVSSENLVNSSKNDEFDAFGQHCALKLRKLEDLCPLQKVIAEKLISEVFYHAQLNSLSSESCILPTTSKEVKKEPVEEPIVPPIHIKEEIE